VAAYYLGRQSIVAGALISVHDYVKKILTARVYDVAIESLLDPMPRLSSRIGGPIHLKREDLQPVFSFKLRGAYNKMSQLDRGLSSDWGSGRDQGMTSRVFWLAEDQGWGGFCAWWKPGSMERAAVLT
jgi:Pyridoxal-phosphate dependent enzyme